MMVLPSAKTMATAFDKLRKAHKADMKQMHENIKMNKDARKDYNPSTSVIVVAKTPVKMIVDKSKLQNSINKTRESLKMIKNNQKKIVVITEIPSTTTAKIVETSAAPEVRICKARNINGTPCKCKATKLGQFCGKHAP